MRHECVDYRTDHPEWCVNLACYSGLFYGTKFRTLETRYTAFCNADLFETDFIKHVIPSWLWDNIMFVEAEEDEKVGQRHQVWRKLLFDASKVAGFNLFGICVLYRYAQEFPQIVTKYLALREKHPHVKRDLMFALAHVDDDSNCNHWLLDPQYWTGYDAEALDKVDLTRAWWPNDTPQAKTPFRVGNPYLFDRFHPGDGTKRAYKWTPGGSDRREGFKKVMEGMLNATCT